MGFAVFALGYLYTIIYIAIDMRKRDRMYADMIEGDLARLDSMGLAARMTEFDAEL